MLLYRKWKWQRIVQTLLNPKRFDRLCEPEALSLHFYERRNVEKPIRRQFMNFQQIETFLTVAETQNISHASESLYVSQSTVSYRLKSLEDELGFLLFERKKGCRSIQLTQKARSFAPIAVRWMQLWQEIQILSNEDSKLPLVLSGRNSINSYLLAPLYKTLANRNALFDLTIKNQETERVYRAIESWEADIGLVYEKQQASNLMIEPLFSEHMYLIRICEDPNELRSAYHPSELRVEDEFFLNSSSSYCKWHDEWFGMTARPYVSISNESLLLDFLDQPQLWSIVPASVAQMFLKMEHIKTYDILDPPEDRVCYRVTNKFPAEARKRNIQLFNDYLRTYIHDLSYVTLPI